jgi:hypothetical protein
MSFEVVNIPVEQVEVVAVDLLPAQDMSDEQYAFECLYDND